MASLHYSLPSSSAIAKVVAHQIQENKSIFFFLFLFSFSRQEKNNTPSGSSLTLSSKHAIHTHTHTHTTSPATTTATTTKNEIQRKRKKTLIYLFMRCGSYQNNNKRTNEFFFSFLILLGMYTPAQKVWSAGSWLFFFWRRKKKDAVCVCVQVRLHASRTDAERLP